MTMPTTPPTASAEIEQPRSPAERRRRHAAGFLLVVQPGALALGFLFIAITAFVTPDAIDGSVLVAAAILGIAFAGVALATRWIDPIRLVAPAILFDAAFLFGVSLVTPDPADASLNLLFPLIAIAYFGTTRQVVAMAVGIAVTTTAARGLIAEWEAQYVIPPIAFIVLVIGVLLAFINQRTRTTEAELEHLVGQQAETIAGLRRLEEMRARLVANVSHELRTPLTTMIGFLETILREDMDLSEAQRTSMTEHARDGAMRLLGLVEDLLTFDTAQTVTLQRATHRCSALVDDALSTVAVPPGFELRTRAEADPAVDVDSRRICQVLSNLVVNAIHHGASPAEVIVRRPAGSCVVIDVEDCGDGVPEGHAAELFRPFARFSTRTDSTGLGLAISRATAEAHGGSLVYGRTSAGRTRFRLRLPLGTEPCEPVAEDPASVAAGTVS